MDTVSIPPSGESDVKRLLLMIKSNDHREKWLGRLSQIAITRDGGQNSSPYVYVCIGVLCTLCVCVHVRI